VTLPGPATVSIDISSNNQMMINGKTNFEQVYLQSINKLIEIVLLRLRYHTSMPDYRKGLRGKKHLH
jgi:hypothetical protein